MSAIARAGRDARLRLPAALLALAAVALAACGSAGTTPAPSASTTPGPATAHDLQALSGAAAAGPPRTATFPVTPAAPTASGRPPPVHASGSVDFGARP